MPSLASYNPSRARFLVRGSKRRSRRTRTTRGIAQRALKIAKGVASNQEVKYSDFGIASTSLGQLNETNSWSIAEIAQGDTNNTRDGNKIVVKAIRGNIRIVGNVTATVPQFIRLMMVQDTLANGATAPTTLADTLMTLVPHLGANVTDDMALFDTESNANGRYRILWKKHFKIDDDRGSSDSVRIVPISLRFKKGIPVQFEEATAEPLTNRFIFVAWNDVSNIGNAPAMRAIFRVIFMDS